jgi:hypothetical protein
MGGVCLDHKDHGITISGGLEEKKIRANRVIRNLQDYKFRGQPELRD